MLEERWL